MERLRLKIKTAAPGTTRNMNLMKRLVAMAKAALT
jgi:hypothetical protein